MLLAYTGAYPENRHLEDGPVLLRNGTTIDGLHGRAPHGHVPVTVSTTCPFISRFLSQVHGLVAAHPVPSRRI